MKSNKKHLFVEFIICKKMYECNFSLELNLMENIILLVKLVKNELISAYEIDKYFVVYEKDKNIKLNMFLPLKELNLDDNLTLVVY